MAWRLRVLFRSVRGLRTLASRAIVAFGLLSALVQLYSAIFVPSHALPHPVVVFFAVVVLSVGVAVALLWPKKSVSRMFKNPEMEIVVKVGDLFQEDSQIVVGFPDTFDTDTTDDLVIHSSSLQGALLEVRYMNDPARLDHLLGAALKDAEIIGQAASTKAGKKDRYATGTVAAIRESGKKTVYAVAYTTMGDNLVVKSSIHDLWSSLNSLWNSVYLNGALRPVSMPLIGTQLARIQCVDRETILRMILISFVARSREARVCSKLTVVVTESDWLKMNSLEIEAFMKTL